MSIGRVTGKASAPPEASIKTQDPRNSTLGGLGGLSKWVRNRLVKYPYRDPNLGSMILITVSNNYP